MQENLHYAYYIIDKFYFNVGAMHELPLPVIKLQSKTIKIYFRTILLFRAGTWACPYNIIHKFQDFLKIPIRQII